VSSWFGCSATHGDAHACGNAAHALAACIVSEWHGRGAVHGQSEALASRGNGRWGEGEVSGEVTGLGPVGAGLPASGVHGGHGVDLGRGSGSSSMS
jgi:hypothetical protein